MNGAWQPDAGEHLPASWQLKILAQVLEHVFGRAFFKPLHDLCGVCGRRGPEQEVKVLRHQNISNDFEVELVSQVGERGNESALESFRVENTGAPIGARGQVMKMIQAVKMPRRRHERILPQIQKPLPLRILHRRHYNSMSAPPAPWASASAEILIISVMPPYQPTSGWRISAHSISRSMRKPQRVASCSPVVTSMPWGTFRRSSA